MLKLILAGGRDYNDWVFFKAKVSNLISNYSLDNIEIISGCASGADSLAIRYAKEHNISLVEFPADWKNNGRAAGPIRNKNMSDYGNALIAFWDGNSRGTKNMIKVAKDNNLAVRVVKIDSFKS